jgi:hypothetical protein
LSSGDEDRDIQIQEIIDQQIQEENFIEQLNLDNINSNDHRNFIENEKNLQVENERNSYNENRFKNNVNSDRNNDSDDHLQSRKRQLLFDPESNKMVPPGEHPDNLQVHYIYIYIRI